MQGIVLNVAESIKNHELQGRAACLQGVGNLVGEEWNKEITGGVC